MTSQSSQVELSVAERAILRTVLYSSLFDYPLTISELRENLQGLEMEESEILEAYKSSHALNSAIDYHDGYFCPEGRIELIELRQWRQAHSQRILRANWWLLKLICCIPHTRMVALSGSAAHLNLDADGDIDLFIVTRGDRVWSVAVKIILLTRLLGRRKMICFNFILSDGRLPIDRKDLFSANQIVHLKPLMGLEVYRRFVDANDFVTDFYPNFRCNDSLLDCRPHWVLRGIKRITEWVLRPGLAHLQELVCRATYSWYLKRQSQYWESPEEVVMGNDLLKLHTESHRKGVMQQFEKVVANAVQKTVLKERVAE